MATPKPSPGPPPPGYGGDSEERLIQQKIMSGLGGSAGGGGNKANPMVWMDPQFLQGMKPPKAPQSALFGPRPTYQGAGPLSGPIQVPFSEAKLAPLDWSESMLKEFVNTGIMNKVRGFDTDMGMPEIQAAWEYLVQSSVTFNSKGGSKWTPWTILNSYGKPGAFGTVRRDNWEYDVATGERLRYVGPLSKTVTSKHVDLSSPEDVKALTTQMLRELLGRAPGDKELAQFRSSINSLERSRPEVATTVQTISPETGEVVGESTTTSGGVSDTARASIVQDKTVDTKEYGKYQAATTYWDAMMQMISGG